MRPSIRPLGLVPLPAQSPALVPVLVASLALLAGCGDGPPAASAVGAGEPPPTVAEAVAEAGDIDGLESLAVWHAGQLVVEEYLSGGPDTPRDVRSVTKSVTSLLVGTALDDGAFSSVDQPIGELLADIGPTHGPAKAELRLRDLLTMSAGLAWDEDGLEEYLDWQAAPDPVAHYLAPPGRCRGGGSGSSTRRVAATCWAAWSRPVPAPRWTATPSSGCSARWASRGRPWDRLADGSVNAASGLDLRTLDLIRLGRLVLAEGAWQDRSIVDPSWVRQATTTQIQGSDGTAYGFQWWIEGDPVPVVVASGYGGQTLAVAPRTSSWCWWPPATGTSRPIGPSGRPGPSWSSSGGGWCRPCWPPSDRAMSIDIFGTVFRSTVDGIPILQVCRCTYRSPRCRRGRS